MANPLSLVWDLIANDDASPAFDRVAVSADGAAAATDRASASMDVAGKSSEKNAGLLGTLSSHLGEIVVAAGLVDLAVKSAKAAAQFQSSMILIQTQAGASAAEVKKMSSAILDLAGPVAQAPEALANSLYHVESVGLRGAAALNVVKLAAEGAKVGHADLEQTTNALTAAFASGIPGVQNMSQAMGALNATVGAGDMKMSDLNDAMSTGLLVTVKQYGLTMNDVGAALADFGDNNIRGADAATKLRMAVQAFAAPMKAGAASFEKLGLSTTQLATDMQKGGLNLALTDLVNHLNKAGDTGTKAGQILTDMFGKKAGSGVLTLVGTYSRFEQKLGQVKSGADNFAADWQATTDTVTFQWDRLKDGMQALEIELGTKLLPVANKLAGEIGNGLTKAVKTATTWFQNHKKAASELTTVLKDGLYGALVLVSAQLAVTAAEAVIAAAPFVALSVVVGATVVAVVNLFKHNAQLRQSTIQLGKDVETWGVGVYKRDLIPAYQKLVAGIKDTIKWVEVHREGFIKLGQGIETYVVTVYKKDLVPAFDTVRTIIIDLCKWVDQHRVGLEQLAKIVGTVVEDAFKALALELYADVQMFRATWTAVHALLIVFGDLWDVIAKVQIAFEKLLLEMKASLLALILWFDTLENKILGALTNVGSWLYDVGKNMLMGLLSGLQNGLTDVVNWIRTQLGNSLVNATKAALHINSPSLLFATEVGGPIMEGIAKGITDNIGLTHKALTNASTSMVKFGATTVAGSGSPYSKIGGAGVVINNYNTMQPNQDMSSFAAVVSRTTARSMK